MAEPDSLLELALGAIAKYIYELCSKLTMISHDTKERSTPKKQKLNCPMDMQKVKEICISLKKMIAEVPTDLANDLTNKLLDSVDNWEYQIGKCKKESIQAKIYEDIVMSIIHPGLTAIEHGEELLECEGMFSETVFCSSLCVTVLLKNLYSFRNLRKLYVRHESMKCKFTSIEFPEQLIEFSGVCTNEILDKIMKSCKKLKYLDIMGSRGITDVSVDVLLKMTHLEKLNITNTRITHKGIKCFLGGLIEIYGKSPSLKYFGFSCKGFQHFSCLENLPELKISLGLFPGQFANNIGFSQMCAFKNICGLQIETTLDNLNELLQKMGKQLIYLDAQIEYIGPNSDNEDFAEVVKIGQYCSVLKCLHISISYYFLPCILNYRRQLLPGFQTIRCLLFEVQDQNTIKSADCFLYFLISQCSNVRKLTLAFDKRMFDVFHFIYLSVQLDYMKKIEYICFQPFCDKCSGASIDDENFFVRSKVREILNLLTAHCSGLRVIGLEQTYMKRLCNSQRLRFVPTWCACE
ncbi:hypothetical protein C0J52_26896 [Blattella germanica]|nr:hypothetical protein C0J52_26896 [Blattella germanica]PSN29870.1 hypothetical protein C0J52_26896 [Blattella germanica]PSN29871.1 hypothetical protein C0J52_26896 [Blattella germanica]